MAKYLLDIITVTKDDFNGVKASIDSAEAIRANFNVRQIIIDSSNTEIKRQIEDYTRNKINLYYFWQTASGISAAFNLGLEKADADWIWSLNGGDELHPELDLKSFIYILNENQADAVIFQMQRKQSGKIRRHPSLWDLWPPFSLWIQHPGTLVRLKIFKEYGYFDKKYRIAMDFDRWLKFFSEDTVVNVISIPIALFDENGLSSQMNQIGAKEVHQIIFKYTFRLLKKWLRSFILYFRTLRKIKEVATFAADDQEMR